MDAFHIYELMAINYHQGESLHNGHYYSIVFVDNIKKICIV